MVVGAGSMCFAALAMNKLEQKKKVKEIDRENWKTIRGVSIWFIVIGTAIFVLSWIANSIYKLGL